MRIGILAKETLMRQALTSLLDRRGRFEVVAQEKGARELLLAAKRNMAQVLLIEGSGLEPDDIQFVLGAKTYGEFVVVLITGELKGDEFGRDAFDRVVSRDATADELYDAIQEVGQDVKVPGRSMVRERRRGVRDDSLLTRREYEIARLVAQGLSNRRISSISGLREQSVKNLVSVIMRKMSCENRVQVALKLVNADYAKSAEEAAKAERATAAIEKETGDAVEA